MILKHTFCRLAFVLMTVASLLACDNPVAIVVKPMVNADSLINVAHKNHDYNRLLELADTLQVLGEITDIQADYWRGYVYQRQRKMRLAEKYWYQAVNAEIHGEEGLTYYAKAANRLSGALLLKGEYEATMRVAVPALDKMRDADYRDNSDFAYLLVAVGCCQLKLGSPSEAEENFTKAHDLFLKTIDSDPCRANYASAIAGLITITDNYLQQNQFNKGYDWMLKFMELLDEYEQQPNPDADFIDKQRARLNIYLATTLEGMGRAAEAELAFDDAMKSDYVQTNEGKLTAINYLMSAGRWDEAAKNFEILDRQIQEYGVTMSMDLIQHYLLPKYRANVMAHHNDAAVAVSMQICEQLDTAITLMQSDAAMELATIYSTQQKEREIVQQKSDLERQRYMAIVIVLLLVTFTFGLVLFLRHQANKRLRVAYSELAIANERTKESLRMKTSFIQQMSHEIRTPLNILAGFTQVLTSPDMELDEATRQEANTKVLENTERITELVNKMLELSDASSKTVIERNDSIKVIQLAMEAVNAINSNGKYTIPVDLQMGEGTEELSLKTNEKAAARALGLLLDNAERFTREGHVALKVYKGNRTVQFIVEDTGIGIPASEAEHIFEEFVQLNEYVEGTGIGLTVARSLCRRLGGDVVLDTAYTAGARFLMTLPCKE